MSNANNAQLINQTSGTTEYYTPLNIIEAAKKVMHGIDLDPASSHVANERIGAITFYRECDNGLALPWSEFLELHSLPLSR